MAHATIIVIAVDVPNVGWAVPTISTPGREADYEVVL
jgi:hypothetical protein